MQRVLLSRFCAFLHLFAAAGLAIALTACAPAGSDAADAPAASVVHADHPELNPDPQGLRDLTDAQWKERLTDEQYYILRKAGTERPFTSPLNDLKHDVTPGDFRCAGCDTVLFRTANKFRSGTGWPSFDRPATDQSVVEEVENDFYRRTEVRCATCNGHLGHVFPDGPRDTTGLRYCINGDALVFLGSPDALPGGSGTDTDTVE